MFTTLYGLFVMQHITVVMWRAMHRFALRGGRQTCRPLVNASSSRCYSLRCLGNGHHFRGSSGLGQFHRWSSGVPVGAEPFLNGSSGSYVEAMYESWQIDRSSVHKVRACLQTLLLNQLCVVLATFLRCESQRQV